MVDWSCYSKNLAKASVKSNKTGATQFKNNFIL